MKSVLISIQPLWVDKIISGEKTIEVRKSKPKLTTPFKCYIYMTLPRGCVTLLGWDCVVITKNGDCYYGGGKVIGEFTCDNVCCFENSFFDNTFIEVSDLACIGFEQLALYLGKNDYGYGWHITDLKIYDKPKELSEFFHYCGDCPNCEGCEAHYFSNTESGREEYCCSVVEGCKPLTHAPQSWCYVVEI